MPPVEPPTLREEHSLTDEHWQAISAAIPSHVKAGANWAEIEPIVRADLNEAIVLFRTLSGRRQRYPIVEERRHMRRIISLTTKLEAEMRWVLGRKFVFDVAEPDRPNRMVRELIWAREKAKFCSEYNDTSKAFRGRQDPNRKHLYQDVLVIWTRHLQGRLENYWVTKNGDPRGPLVEFFVACVQPVLGDETPRRGGIVDIIERERKRRLPRTPGEKALGGLSPPKEF